MDYNKTGMVTVLKNRDFSALWLSQLISKVGDNFAVVAALVLINELAAKPGLAVVVIAAAMTIPQLFALASGVLVDRFSRKPVPSPEVEPADAVESIAPDSPGTAEEEVVPSP